MYILKIQIFNSPNDRHDSSFPSILLFFHARVKLYKNINTSSEPLRYPRIIVQPRFLFLPLSFFARLEKRGRSARRAARLERPGPKWQRRK